MSLQNFAIRYRKTCLFPALEHPVIARGPVHRHKMRQNKKGEHGFGIIKTRHALAGMVCAVFMLDSAYATDRFCPSLPGSSWMSWVEVESRLKDQGLRMVRLRISEDRCYDVMVIDGHGQNHTLLINPVTAKIIVQRKL